MKKGWKERERQNYAFRPKIWLKKLGWHDNLVNILRFTIWTVDVFVIGFAGDLVLAGGGGLTGGTYHRRSLFVGIHKYGLWLGQWLWGPCRIRDKG